MTSPDIFAEIYALILKKNFTPEVKPLDDPNTYKMYLWSPNKQYFTIYELTPEKIKWIGGVLPFRILK